MIRKKYEGKQIFLIFKYIKSKDDSCSTKENDFTFQSNVRGIILYKNTAVETIIPTILKIIYWVLWIIRIQIQHYYTDYAKYFNNNKLIEKKKFERIFTKERIGHHFIKG